MMDANRLVNAYLGIGSVGLACCLLMHHWGAEGPSTPITVEYARGNPLAMVFFASALISSSLVAWLFHCGEAKAEAILYLSVSVCIGLLIISSPDSAVHLSALLAAVCCAAFTPVIFALKSEFSLWSIMLLIAPLSLTFVVAMATLAPNGPMGLGIAERLWYGVSYFVSAAMINRLQDDGRLATPFPNSTKYR